MEKDADSRRGQLRAKTWGEAERVGREDPLHGVG